MKRLNIKLAVSLVLGLLAMGVGVHLLHAFQVDRNSQSVMEQAQALYEAGDLEEALQAALRYKNLRPEDLQGSKLVADIAFDIAEEPGATRRKKINAIGELERTLRLDSEDTERRRKLLDYYVKNGWMTSAIDHVKLLRDPRKPDPKLEIIAARCYATVGTYPEAARICQTLVGYDPLQKTFSENPSGKNDVTAYAMLADLLREKKQGTEAQAEQVIEKMIELNGESSEAHLAAHDYWKRKGNDEHAKQSLERAFELDPEGPQVAFLKAAEALDEKRLDDAEALVGAALRKHPDEAMLYRVAAIIEQRRQRPDEAIKIVKQGLERLPENEVLLEYLVGAQLDRGNLDEARKAYTQLKATGLIESANDYFEGQFLMAEKKWNEAVERLLKAKGKLLRDPQLVAQVDTLIARSYQALGNVEKAIEHYRLAQNAQGLTSADLGLAQMLAATGRNADALKLYEVVAKGYGDRAFDLQYIWQPLLELRTWDQMRQPKEKRDWSKVEELLAGLNQAGKLDPISSALLQGDLLYKKDQVEDARTLYTTALHANPNNEALWTARLRLELEAGGPEKALRLAEQVPAAIENGVVLRLVRASIFSRMPGETGKAGLMSVERGMEQLGTSDQLRLLHGLVLEYRKLGDRESTRRLLAKMMSGWEKDFFSRNMSFEMAREDGDIKTMEQMAAQLRKISEPNSPYPPVFEAVTKISAVGASQRELIKANPDAKTLTLTSEQKKSLAQARRQLEDVAKNHTAWNEPHKWLADIHALENNPDGMLEQLNTALEKGPLDSNRTKQLYQLLVAKGQNAKAEEVYKRLSGDKRAGTELSQVNILIQDKRFDEARALLDTIEPEADTPLDELLMYADARRRTGDLPKAEAALQQAVQVDSSSAHAWVFLVSTLVSAGKQAEAEAAVQNAKERVPDKDRELVLAQCYEALRDLKRAEQSFLKAVGERPRDLLANQAVASFYLRTNRRETAMKYLDAIRKEGAAATSPGDKEIVSWAERGSAVAIATDGNWQQFKEAEALLLKNEDEIRQSGREPDASQILLRIALLVDREEPSSVRAAVELFEELQRRQPLQASEMVNFARQYERIGEWSKAKSLMLNVLAGRDPDPLYFLGYAEMLLRNNELADVDSWLDRYDRVGANYMSRPIRVKLRVRQGRDKEAVALIRSWLGPLPWRAGQLDQVQVAARLLHQLRQYAEAEKIWRGYMQTEPSGVIMLATTVGMYRPLDDAIQLLEASLKFHTPRDVLVVGMEILRARKADAKDQHFAALGRWYQAAAKASPNDPQLEMLIGDIYEIRGRLDKAEEQYRKVLARTDLDPMTRAHIGNNLAFILSTQRKNTDEAVELIDKAMEVYGPSSDLLDTRGVVYLAADKPDKALADFREAVLIPSAMKWVHLAFAQSALKDREAARASLKKAHDLDLKRQDLYDAEWDHYEKLARELGY
jgi:Tfp pilus assembly protein PilF